MTKDIVSSLKLSDTYKKFKTSSFRKNLFYDCYYQNMLDNPYEHLKSFIEDCLNEEDDQELPEVLMLLFNLNLSLIEMNYRSNDRVV